MNGDGNESFRHRLFYGVMLLDSGKEKSPVKGRGNLMFSQLNLNSSLYRSSCR